MQSAYDDYADKIKEQLKELETSPGNVLEQLEPQRLVPERGNDGIGGRERKKVSVMGAKLDADVAGALVLDAKPPEEEHERLFQLGVRSMRAGEYKKASTAFTQAVAAFPGGMTTRRGGEYSVWLAQARARHAPCSRTRHWRSGADDPAPLTACGGSSVCCATGAACAGRREAGRRDEAAQEVRGAPRQGRAHALGQRALHLPGASRLAPLATCLQSGPFRAQERSACSLAVAGAACSSPGPSPRARRASQAPELKLSEENFMKIEMPDTSDDWDRKRIRPKAGAAHARQHLSGIGRPRTSLQPSPTLTGLRPSSQEEKDPPPEKYSVEWYLERARETERSKATPDASRSGGSVAALALLAAASTAALVLF